MPPNQPIRKRKPRPPKGPFEKQTEEKSSSQGGTADFSVYDSFDRTLRRERGVSFLVGIDEVGRGPLAGPVFSAAVLFPPRELPELAEVRDSKRLTPAARERLFPVIRSRAAAIGVGWASPAEIDRLNILQATFLSMRRALERLGAPEGSLIIVDGNMTIPGVGVRQEALVAGDRTSLSVAAASVVAKVLRDRWMGVLDRRFPEYGFARNKGYGSADHCEVLRARGPSPIHRATFIRKVLGLAANRSFSASPAS